MVVEINNDSSHIYSSDTIISEYTNRPIDENAEEVIGPEFWCVTCHVKLRTAHTAIQHVGGKPHKKKVVAKDTEIKAVNENFKRKLPSNNNNNDPEECVLAKRQKAIDATRDKNLKCEDCNLEFINTVMAIQHFKGKKHANVIARKMEAEKTAILKKWQDPRPVCKGFDSRRGRGNGGASRGGVSRGGARGSARGGTRGGVRGGTRGGTRGGSRGDTRGGNRGGIQPSVRGTFSSGSRGGNRGGNWETGMGSRQGGTRGSNRGSGRGGSWGDVNRASTNSHEDSGIGGIRGSGRSFQRGRGSNLDILRNGGNNHINQGMDMNKRPEGESVTGQLRQAMHKLYGDNSYHKSSFSGVYDNVQHDAARNNRFNVDYGLKNSFSSSVGHHPKEHFDLDSYQTQSLTLRSKSQHRDMFINDISDSHEYSRYSRPMDMRLEIGSASHPYLSQWR